uniref:Uncharacterized protein n=1 Tax=Mycena chlorophos TaxID=658473 RepID=A0ABQ0L6M5_MYCCL|nr:predicted protein [Mycena chlorophos]
MVLLSRSLTCRTRAERAARRSEVAVGPPTKSRARNPQPSAKSFTSAPAHPSIGIHYNQNQSTQSTAAAGPVDISSAALATAVPLVLENGTNAVQIVPGVHNPAVGIFPTQRRADLWARAYDRGRGINTPLPPSPPPTPTVLSVPLPSTLVAPKPLSTSLREEVYTRAFQAAEAEHQAYEKIAVLEAIPLHCWRDTGSSTSGRIALETDYRRMLWRRCALIDDVSQRAQVHADLERKLGQTVSLDAGIHDQKLQVAAAEAAYEHWKVLFLPTLSAWTHLGCLRDEISASWVHSRAGQLALESIGTSEELIVGYRNNASGWHRLLKNATKAKGALWLVCLWVEREARITCKKSVGAHQELVGRFEALENILRSLS